MTILSLTITLTLIFFTVSQNSVALNSDGIALLSFKYTVISDPLSALGAWNYDDVTPCAWPGIACSDDLRVVSVSLPSSSLLGSLSPELGTIDSLRRLDLSGNLLNGSLPAAIFNASNLELFSLSGNFLSGQIPGDISRLTSLTQLNLSDNAFTGKIPGNLGSLPNLTLVSLKSNFLFGEVPSGLSNLEFLDLSANLLNETLPEDFGGERMKYLNLSYNKISGRIPEEFAELIPSNATIDLSFNALTGAIPESETILSQRKELFSGNPDLCGKPLENLCTVPSSLSTPPNITSSSSSSSPAIAAIPKTINSGDGASTRGSGGGMRPGTIAGIAAADIAGIAALAAVILFVYRVRRKRYQENSNKSNKDSDEESPNPNPSPGPSQKWWPCLGGEISDGASSEGEGAQRKVVTVDGERPELELERLLKASAYVIGASSESIVYKAVMEDGSALAVRRIGKGFDEKMRDFEANVRLVSRLRHHNIVRLRGFYWGHDEKLVVYDFVSNGSLATTGTRRAGSSSPLHQTLETRVKIARGIARGLAYVHDKKHVHGNIKPTNILLTPEMEPIISDLGLDRLVIKPSNGSARHFGSHRSDSDSITLASNSPYRAPESLQTLSGPNHKPNPKWDVFSFGVILLELLTGRVFSDREVVSDDVNNGRVLRLVDSSIRVEAEGEEEVVAAILKLGFSCASIVPQKRPTMKEAVQVLEKFPYNSFSAYQH